MVHITTVRNGLIVVAYTVNDNTVFVAAGFTRRQAERRLLKTLDQ